MKVLGINALYHDPAAEAAWAAAPNETFVVGTIDGTKASGT